MSVFAPALQPESNLGFLRILSPTARLEASPLCLGAINFGKAWESSIGECSKEDSFKIMDAFYRLGGNFIDTANVYQNDESKEWVGHRG